jgi:hypothetical protein
MQGQPSPILTSTFLLQICFTTFLYTGHLFNSGSFNNLGDFYSPFAIGDGPQPKVQIMVGKQISGYCEYSEQISFATDDNMVSIDLKFTPQNLWFPLTNGTSQI